MKPGDKMQLPAVANDNARRVDRRYRYAWWPGGDDSDFPTRAAAAMPK
jgi:hypothetical protein